MIYYYFSQIDGPETTSTSNTTHIKCEGDAVTISCEATGVPVPDVKIVYENQVLKSATSKVNHTLPSLAANQFGAYICSANNTIGIENVSTNVNKSGNSSKYSFNHFRLAALQASLCHMPLMHMVK